MSDWITFLFSTTYFEPHSEHFVNNPELMWFIIISNAVIALAYYSIPVALARFVYVRRDIPFNWMFFLFSAFIFLCGTHHIMHIASFWRGIYPLEGLTDFLTAGSSLSTAVLLWSIYPQAIKIPSLQEIRTQNKKLKEEISHRKKAERRVVDLNKNLEKRVEDRTRKLAEALLQKDLFLSMVAHELKTPATGIKAYTQVLLKRYQQEGDSTEVKYLSRMDMLVGKLNKLIIDLLDLSRTNTFGSLKLYKKTFYIDSLVKEAVDSFQNENTGPQVEITGTSGAKVYADRFRIGQVLQNLLSNAVKYSPNSDKIQVKTALKDGMVVLSVRDFGIGIDKKYQDKIFERYFRVGGQSNKGYPGLGVGLYICSEIIKLHGGRIYVSSKPDKGSIFSFNLPVKGNQ